MSQFDISPHKRYPDQSGQAYQHNEDKDKKVSQLHDQTEETPLPTPVNIPKGIEIVEAEPIIDRKSAFVGRACRITDPSQVQSYFFTSLADV